MVEDILDCLAAVAVFLLEQLEMAKELHDADVVAKDLASDAFLLLDECDLLFDAAPWVLSLMEWLQIAQQRVVVPSGTHFWLKVNLGMRRNS